MTRTNLFEITRYKATLTLSATYLAILFFFNTILKFNLFQSDVLAYWAASLDWRHPFSLSHAPGYPLLIAGLRGITFGALEPLVLMQLIVLAAFITGIITLNKIFNETDVAKPAAASGILIFGLAPFIGITTLIHPLADILAIAIFLIGLLFFLRQRLIVAAVFFGFGLMVHKALWLFVGVLWIVYILKSPRHFSKKLILSILISLLPLGLLWLAGCYYHNSLTWIFSKNIEAVAVSQGPWPIMDGLIGTFFGGGINGIIKGIVVWGVFGLSIALAFLFYKSRQPEAKAALAIALSIIILSLTLNQHEIFAVVRFGRLLVLPFIWRFKHIFTKEFFGSNLIGMPILFILIGSQFIWAWYMAAIYFA